MEGSHRRKSIPMDEIEKFVDEYCESKNFSHIDYVVAIANGGTELGKLFAKILMKPIFFIDYSSKKGLGTGKHIDSLTDFPSYRYKNLLIVDDIVDSGHTLHDISTFYNDKACGVEYFVMYLNDKNERGFECDCYERLGEDKPWIVFPWEKEWNKFTVGHKYERAS